MSATQSSESSTVTPAPVVYPADPAKFVPSPFQDHKGPPERLNRIEKFKQNPPCEAPKWTGPSPFNRKRGRPKRVESPPPEKKSVLLPNKYTPSGIVDFSALQQKGLSFIVLFFLYTVMFFKVVLYKQLMSYNEV